jgi:ParB-like chromosome segregation protein Spo0J
MKENIAESLLPLCVDIGSVKTDAKNNRQHPERNLEALKKSLEAYGQRKPIVVNAKTKIIEAGNGLYLAAFKLGWSKIAAVMVEDDPNTAKGYAIMDNQSGALSEWDLPNLSSLLNELEVEKYNLELTGFTLDEINNIVHEFQPVGEDTQPRLDEKKKATCPECGCVFTP